MAYMEGPYFCSPEEYFAGRGSRLSCEQLQRDEIYTLMAMGEDDTDEAHIKTPSKILEVQAQRAGLYIVRFSTLDEDMQEYHTGAAEFQNGLWVRDLDELEPDEMPVLEAYFTNQADDFDSFLREVTSHLTRELVAV